MVTEADLEEQRPRVLAHCYRMLGSVIDAEDAVQDTLMRAWKARDRFEGRSALSSWLYRIATNVCLDALGRRTRRRMVPFDDAAAVNDPGSMTQHSREHWVEPIPSGLLAIGGGDPSAALVQRDNVRLAFVAALQRLAPKQRAVLLLRDVLGFTAEETAQSLETTTAAVNSALQRARAAVADDDRAAAATSEDHERFLVRYMDAFGRYDIEELVSLLHEDVQFCMPPYALWLRGPDRVGDWMRRHDQCRGSVLQRVEANGAAAFAQYRPTETAGRYRAWAIVTLDVDRGAVVEVHNFLDVDTLFPRFGLALELDAEGEDRAGKSATPRPA